jgi:hypothetical protein
MMHFVFLVVPVGPTFAHITNASSLFAHNDVFFLAIVPCIKELNVLMSLQDVYTYLLMLSSMKMFFLFKLFIQMPVLSLNEKFSFYLHISLMRVPL